MNKKVEILAPAGSFECLVAALKSGADAIYVGGDKFGARANANNFSLDELKQAIDLVHLHGKQLYLTVNTLLKEQEICEELYEYLAPLYEHGIDAVIVQDLGVLQYIREQFTDLPIHASTQMTVTNLLGAKFLEQQGVERVVTSRELSVSEVGEIARETNLEIESFVHGALCYSYSGQCLFSSMIGGRSGNRGQCAQPCRLPYEIDGRTDYFMSLKDICTLHDIPDLIEAGVYSFKIEGRMKKPEYVASVTSMYRKYVDLYLKKGRKGYRVSEEDLDILRDIFNRGDFHGGYWKQHNGKEMITQGKPNHTGVPVLQILEQNGRMVRGKALKPLRKGDILEISEKGDNYTLGKEYRVGEMVELSLRKGVVLKKGISLYRTRNQWLIESIYTKLEENKLQEEITGTLVLMVGANAMLNLEWKDCYISVEGAMVQKAEKAAAKKEKLLQQIQKTGNTPFRFAVLECMMDEDIFMPVQQLNQLRRDGLLQLEQEMVRRYRRTLPVKNQVVKEREILGRDEKIPMTVYVETREQLEFVLDVPIFRKIYMDANVFEKVWENKRLEADVCRIHASGKQAYLVLPHIFRNDTIKLYKDSFQNLLDAQLDGIMVRNLEGFAFLKDLEYSGEILLDHHVYMYNNSAVRFWEQNGASGMTDALELTAREIKGISQTNMELVVYGYTPNMISAQCIKKTTDKCTHATDIIKIKDRINKEISVKSCCDYCYNVVYNTCPTCLFDEYDELQMLAPRSLRVCLTIENRKETERVIEVATKFYYEKINDLTEIETTKGHFRRGVR